MQPARCVPLLAALFMLILTANGFGQSAGTPLAQACQKRGIYIGPRHFEKLQDKPFRLDIETCLDGTAWSNLFNFNLQFAAKLDRIQNSVDAFINEMTNTCEGRDIAVRVTALDLDSKSAVREQQAMTLSVLADMLQCSFPYVAAELSIAVPFMLNTQTLRIIHDSPVVTVRPKNGVKNAILVNLFRKKIRNETIAQIKPYLDKYENALADNKDKIRLFRPVVKKLAIQSNEGIVTADLTIDARIPKQAVEEQSAAWISYLQLR